MPEQRPDPDQLLVHVKAEEARAHRGRLRIFFGATAGVGKTYAMLEAARAARNAATRSRTAAVRFGLVAAWFEPEDTAPLFANGPVADGRPQK